MVAIILGILAMIAVPHFSTVIADSTLNGSASEMVAGLQYAGILAARYQRPFGFKADTAGNRFNVFDTNPGSDPPVDANGVVQNPVDKNWYMKDFNAGSPYYGVQIVAVPPGGTVQFYPDGHSGVADSTFAVSYGGKQKTITVSGATGRITVQ